MPFYIVPVSCSDPGPEIFFSGLPQDCNILNADEQRETASKVPNLQEAMERMLEEKEEPRTLVTRETQTSITGTVLRYPEY